MNHTVQQIFQIVLTALFCAVLIEAFIALSLFLWKTGKDYLKPKKPGGQEQKDTHEG